MAVELWLVRHGETEWNAERRMQGHKDIPLNQTGINQAHLLADGLYGQQYAALFSSDLQRTLQTAEILAQRLDLPVQVDHRLREIDQGEWSGLIIDDIRNDFPEELDMLKRDPINRRRPGGESAIEVVRRVWAAADEIALGYPGKRVLVVSHGFTLATLIAAARGVPLEDVRTLIPHNASLTQIEWEKGKHPLP
jgi:broad specificity phosphatase PhoE